jgi:hypothetical protein
MSIEIAFYQKPYSSVAGALSSGFNEQVWRWGLVFNQGNDWSVSENRVRERLSNIRSNLLRTIFGNRHRGKGGVRFFAFKHGSLNSFDQHWHVLMAIEGSHSDWNDLRIAMKVQDIDGEFIRPHKWEKLVQVDWKWREGNRYHSYVSRYAHSGRRDDYFIM